VLDIETKHLHVSCNAVFYEQKFLYAVSMGLTSDPFTLSPSYNQSQALDTPLTLTPV